MKRILAAGSFSLLGVAVLPSAAFAIDLGGSISGGAEVSAGGVSAGVEVGGSASVSVDDSDISGEGSLSGGGRASGGGISAGGGVENRSSFSADDGGISVGSETNVNAGSPRAGSAPVARSAAAPAVVRGPRAAAVSLPARLAPQSRCRGIENQACMSEPTPAEINARTPLYAQALQVLAQSRVAPIATVNACRNGIVQGAMAYSPVQVDAISAGGVQALGGGVQAAPLFVRIVYARQGGYEVREAQVTCQLDAAGTVLALS